MNKWLMDDHIISFCFFFSELHGIATSAAGLIFSHAKHL
jgi:hypothetical protein